MRKILKTVVYKLPYRTQKSLYTIWYYIHNVRDIFNHPLDVNKLAIQKTNDIKLVGFLKIYNEASSGNLERVLRHMSKFCDDIVVCDCESTDNGVEITKRYTSHILHEKNNFRNELSTKQVMLDYALKLRPDWIVWLDADEIFDRNGESGSIRKLCAYGNQEEIDGFLFHEYNLWKSDRKYRIDELWDKVGKINLWKNNGNLHFDAQEGLHRPQHPLGLNNIKPVRIKLIHFGFASQALIDRKYEIYKKNGQRGYMELERLHYEIGIKLKILSDNDFPLSLEEK